MVTSLAQKIILSDFRNAYSHYDWFYSCGIAVKRGWNLSSRPPPLELYMYTRSINKAKKAKKIVGDSYKGHKVHIKSIGKVKVI